MRATAEGRPTVGKKPAKVCVNAGFARCKHDASSPPGHLLIKAARLRTET